MAKVKVIDKGFDEWCRSYERQNPGFYRKFRPSELWPILFQRLEGGKFKTIAQTPTPEAREPHRFYWRT